MTAPAETAAPAPTASRIECAVMDDALDLLQGLAERVADADDVLAILRRRHPEHTFHLVADREGYDGSVHHALVIRRPGAAALSLSVAAATGLPWPLRGVQRARDSELLEVNGRTVGVAEAMARLDLVGDRAAMRLLIDGCLLSAELERDPVDLDAHDLQAAADAFRRAKRLTSAAQTRQWLADRGLSADDFAELVTRQAEFDALRRRRTDAAVGRWLDEHGPELDDLLVAWIEQDAEPREEPGVDALEAELRARPGEMVAAALRAGRPAGLEWHSAASLGSSALTADTGDVITVDLDGKRAVAVVLERRTPPFTRRRDLARTRILQDQLADERRAARVTWFWGTDGETA